MALERIYNVPLRKEFQKAPKYRRAKKAMIALREFLAKHMKTELEKVKIGEYANLEIWKNGIKRPPHHIKIRAVKQDDGIVQAEIVGAPEKRATEKKEVKKKKREIKEEAGSEEKIEEKEDVAEKPKRLGKKALQKELQATQHKIEGAVEELKEQVERKLVEKQEESKEIEREEIKELKHEMETEKRHKPKIPKEDRSQRNKKKELIPGRMDK